MLRIGKIVAAIALATAAITIHFPAFARGEVSQDTSAPLSTDSAGRQTSVVITSVFRVICPEQGEFGTGFLHKSGVIITAAHVTDGCTKIVVALPDNKTFTPASVVASDDRLDLSIIKPEKEISGTPLSIGAQPPLTVGQQIGIWGFPAGYNGIAPMLSVGYVSGIDAVRARTGDIVEQMVINAAVNHGDSGGPVILVETGEVVGVADNKIVPLSDNANTALAALQNQSSGFTYEARMKDGQTKTFSEGQVVAMVLDELRQQVQLVVGHSVMLGDLRQFLQSHRIDP